jgi:hypothetical protein
MENLRLHLIDLPKIIIYDPTSDKSFKMEGHLHDMDLEKLLSLVNDSDNRNQFKGLPHAFELYV